MGTVVDVCDIVVGETVIVIVGVCVMGLTTPVNNPDVPDNLGNTTKYPAARTMIIITPAAMTTIVFFESGGTFGGETGGL